MSMRRDAMYANMQQNKYNKQTFSTKEMHMAHMQKLAKCTSTICRKKYFEILNLPQFIPLNL
jgi:hypothetical protein